MSSFSFANLKSTSGSTASPLPLPGKYGDVSKSASDLLSKDFTTGSLKLDAKTNTSNGYFQVLGTRDSATGFISGELKDSFAHKGYGVEVTTTLASVGSIATQLQLKDALTKGLKLELFGALLPQNKNALKFTTEYKHAHIASTASVDIVKGPTVTGDVIVGADGFVAGGEVSYDLSSAKIQKYSAAVAYLTNEYTVSVHALNSFQSFSGAYYHKVTPQLEAAGKAQWDRPTNTNAKANSSSTAGQIHLEVGGKFILDKQTFFKVKVDQLGKLALGWTQVLREGVKVNLGAAMDTTKLGSDAHKVGLSLILEA